MVLTDAQRKTAIAEVKKAASTYLSSAAAGRIVDKVVSDTSYLGGLIRDNQRGKGYHGGY
jgi:hypothetical protein